MPLTGTYTLAVRVRGASLTSHSDFPELEGFRKIGGKRPALEAQMDEIMEPLRSVWLHTVNYHDDATQKQGRAPFYERSAGLLQKAADLHNALIGFFHDHVVALSKQASGDNHKH